MHWENVPEISSISPIAQLKNYPNPFNPKTVIEYELQTVAYVRLEISDIMGRRVAQLQKGMQFPGFYQIEFDASNLASGIYIYHLHAGNVFIGAGKMMLIK